MRRSLPAALVVASLVVAPLAHAAPTALSAAKAEELRAAARTQADSERGSDPARAADTLFQAGQDLGDPILMLDAVEARRDQAKEARDKALARRGIDEALVALDILYYYEDAENRSASRWLPIDEASLPGQHGRADGLITSLETLIAEIEEEERLAAMPPKPEPKDEGRKPGTGLIAGGAASIVIGVGGVGLMGAGLAIGAGTQREAEALDLPAQNAELDRLDRKGANANIMAYVGGAIAAVGVGVGIGLLVVGLKKRKAAGEPEEEQASMLIVPYRIGLGLVGRF